MTERTNKVHSMKTRPILTSLALASALALALTACGSTSDDDSPATGAGSTLDLISSGTLTVCSDVPYAPFEDFDSSSPSGFKGFDVDVVTKISEGLGLKLKIKDSSFEGLQSGQSLNAKQCDLVASSLTITDDRKKNLDFSDGYYDSEQSLLVPVGSSIAAIGDLSGKKVGVQQGTTGKTYTQENAAGAKIVSFPSDAEMFSAIKAGQVDALLQDLPINIEHTKGGKFTVVEKYKTDEVYGFAMRKGNTALVSAVNGELKKLRDDGQYDTIYNKYFATN
ncbi:MAG: transporter substrate-binding protein [Marmoricola sp.]|nr:transporter substrate-binding protein [Marmoricola sp.]